MNRKLTGILSVLALSAMSFAQAPAAAPAATAAPAVKKYLENGQIVIEKAGKKFTAAGAQLK